MEIIPIEYCEVSGDHIHLNQSLTSCAFAHNCGESEFSGCPLKLFFSKSKYKKQSNQNREIEDMPEFYIMDL